MGVFFLGVVIGFGVGVLSMGLVVMIESRRRWR